MGGRIEVTLEQFVKGVTDGDIEPTTPLMAGAFAVLPFTDGSNTDPMALMAALRDWANACRETDLMLVQLLGEAHHLVQETKADTPARARAVGIVQRLVTYMSAAGLQMPEGGGH